MRAIILVALLFASTVMSLTVTETDPTSQTFEKYIHKFGKKYSPSELDRRRKIFDTNIKKIRAHNAGQHSWKMGVSHMTDWTVEEFSRLNGRRSVTGVSTPNMVRANKKLGAVSNLIEKDWRKHTPQVISAVKDQGNCGSCWAHGSVETIESMHAIRTGNLFVLSTQQVTSCTPPPDTCGDTGGCAGSIAELAYEYVQNSGGITQEWQYSYASYTGNTGNCSMLPIAPKVAVQNYVKLPENDQEAVMEHISYVGVLAVNVDASNWQHYSSGVFDGCDYSMSIGIDHVVQMVGYGVDAASGKEYWLIRNSWSASWGEYGYIRLQRDPVAVCGTDMSPADGVACAPYPKSQRVCGQCGVLFDTSFPITYLS